MKALPTLFIGLIVSVHASAAVINWTNVNGGNWSEPTNWSPNQVPAAGDTANIEAAGTYTVTVGASVTLSELNLGGSTGTQTLTVNSGVLDVDSIGTVANGGMLEMNGNVGVSGSLLVEAGGVLRFTGTSGSKTINGLVLINQGTVEHLEGTVLGDSSTLISNEGLWDFQGDVSLSSFSSPTFENTSSGIIRKSGGTGTAGIYGYQLNQQGTVEVQVGTLTFGGNAGEFTLGGTTTVQSGAIFNVGGGSAIGDGGVFTGAGTSRFSSGTLTLEVDVLDGLAMTGGTLVLGTAFQGDGKLHDLTLSGTMLNGDNVVAGDGTLTVDGSGGVSGSLLVEAGGVLRFTGSSGSKTINGLVLTNQGTVEHVGGTVFGDSATLIQNEGLWDFQGDVSLSGFASPSFENTSSGIIRKSGGTATAGIYGYQLNQQGTVEVHVGTLTFGGNEGQFILGGTTTVQSGATFNVGGGSATGDGGVFTGAGTSRFSSGTLTLEVDVLDGLSLTGGTLVLGVVFQGDGKIHELTMSGIKLTGDNVVAGDGTLNVEGNGGASGTLLVEAGGVLRFTGSILDSKTINGLVLTNQGIVEHVAGTVLGDSATLIQNEGLWDFQGDVSVSGFSSPTFENTSSGIIRKSGGSGSATFSAFDLINKGVLECVQGTLRLPTDFENSAGTLRLSGGTITAAGLPVVSGGTVEGSGTYGGNRFTGGTISPGIGGAGKLFFPSGLQLGAGVTVAIDADGTTPVDDHDQLAVNGTVDLSGANLVFTPTVSMPIGTKLLVIDNDGGDAITGTFAGFADGTLFDVNSELFRTWYAEGTGNDFAVVRSVEGVQLTTIELDPLGHFVLSGLGTNNATYKIFASPVVPSTDWQEIGEVVADPGGKFEFTDPDTHLFDQRFYQTLGP